MNSISSVTLHSREIDPIVGVSFTGLFDFFVHAFGANAWWAMNGRPNNKAGKSFVKRERRYLRRWADIVRLTVTNYCKKHDLRVPNRMTTAQIQQDQVLADWRVVWLASSQGSAVYSSHTLRQV